MIYIKPGYIGNGDANQKCYVRKTYDIYESRMFDDRHGLPQVAAFGI
jgi:hypothetical protein